MKKTGMDCQETAEKKPHLESNRHGMTDYVFYCCFIRGIKELCRNAKRRNPYMGCGAPLYNMELFLADASGRLLQFSFPLIPGKADCLIAFPYPHDLIREILQCPPVTLLSAGCQKP